MACRRLSVALLCSLGAVLALHPPASGDDSAAFQAKLSSLLDRFNDAETGDRLGRAVELCEKRIAAVGSDATVCLELARLKLARDDAQGALDAIASVNTATDPRAAGPAAALRFLIVASSAQGRIYAAPQKDRQKVAGEIERQTQQLKKALFAAAGTAEAANGLLRAEEEHVENASVVNELGKPSKGIDKADLEGKPIKIDELRGKVVLVDFWATWCGPCVHEMPNVLQLAKAHVDDPFVIIGISLDKDRAALDEFLKEKAIPWRQYFDGNGWQNEVAVAWGIHSIPKTYLIDHTGKVRYVGVRGEALAKAVDVLLKRAAAKSE